MMTDRLKLMKKTTGNRQPYIKYRTRFEKINTSCPTCSAVSGRCSDRFIYKEPTNTIIRAKSTWVKAYLHVEYKARARTL